MKLLAAVLTALVLLGCPGEEETPDAGEPVDSGVADAGSSFSFFASNDPVLSKGIVTYENLATGVEHLPRIALTSRAQQLGVQAFVITGLANGPDAGLITLGATKPTGADLIYDVETRTFTPAEAEGVLGALGESGFLPTALHDNGDGTLLALSTGIRGEAAPYDLTFHQVPFDALGSTLDQLSADGFAVSAASAGTSLSLIGARRRGAGASYEHRSAVASFQTDAGLPDVGSTLSAFGPAGFGVSSVVASGDTVYVVGARRAGEFAGRVITRRTGSASAVLLESPELGIDRFLLFDLEAIDGGYLMIGTK